MDDIESLVSPDGSLVSRRLWHDADLYRLEQERIFGRCWLFLGHESQVPKPGDFFTTTMGEAPVIVARGQGGALHVHLNTCRHRGLRSNLDGLGAKVEVKAGAAGTTREAVQ